MDDAPIVRARRSRIHNPDHFGLSKADKVPASAIARSFQQSLALPAVPRHRAQIQTIV
jgi:hypothetical protein